MGNRTNLIITAFVVVLLLTILGQVRADPASFPNELFTQLYRAVQLFGLEGDWTFDMSPLPWELQVARIVAPMVTVISVMLVLARDAWITLSNQRVRLMREHIVLVGLDELSWHFARACADSALPLAVIESDAGNPRIERVRRLNVPVIIGDPMSTTILRRSGVRRAANLVAFMNDAANVELTVSVKTLLEHTGRLSGAAPLRIHCHMTDPSLAHGLEDYPKLFLGRDLVETSFFNADELAARKLSLDHPSDVYADAMARDRVHIVIVGATRMARQVLLQAANTAHFASQNLPRVTVCASDVQRFVDALCADHPGLSHAVEITGIEAPPTLQTLRRITDDSAIAGVSQFVVCGKDDAESLAKALVLRRATLLQRDANAPILLHMRTSGGLARMLESVEPDPETPDGLAAFGTLDEILNEETIINARQDDLARALHENYLDEGARHADFAPEAPSHMPWRNLAEGYRRDNRHEADHLDSKLRAVGCVESDVDAVTTFEPDEIELIARIEKNRFIASRYVAGWRHGLARSAFGKVTDLRPPEALADRSYDLASAASTPQILRHRAGRGIRRRCVIGVTGHRMGRALQQRASLTKAIEDVLDAIVAEHSDAAFTLLSPLAEGADRLVARIALERIPQVRLEVPLPLPYEIYARDFGSHESMSRGESIEEFQALLGRASFYVEMPLKFATLAELEQTDPDGQQQRAQQYALAGAYVTQRSHELIAVWDGIASNLIGGTAQVVSWRQAGVAAPYQFPEAFFPVIVPRAPFIVPPDPPPDFVARRSTLQR